MAKEIKLFATYTREYNFEQSITFDENNPDLVEWLNKNGITFDELDDLSFADAESLWNMVNELYFAEIDEVETEGDERYIQFAGEVL